MKAGLSLVLTIGVLGCSDDATSPIHPLVTLHHFSNPVWLADPRDLACRTGPSDANLCGLGSPGGAADRADLDH